MKPLVIDFDDLQDERQLVDHVAPWLFSNPLVKATAYAIPNRLGPVHEMRKRWPQIEFAIHGFEHTYAECLAWSDEETDYYLQRALNMGYAPVFKAPNWLHTEEVIEACTNLGIVLHTHKSTPVVRPGLRIYHEDSKTTNALHTHITQNPATDWIGTHPGFTPQNIAPIGAFAFVSEAAWEELP